MTMKTNNVTNTTILVKRKCKPKAIFRRNNIFGGSGKWIIYYNELKSLRLRELSRPTVTSKQTVSMIHQVTEANIDVEASCC